MQSLQGFLLLLCPSACISLCKTNPETPGAAKRPKGLVDIWADEDIFRVGLHKTVHKQKKKNKRPPAASHLAVSSRLRLTRDLSAPVARQRHRPRCLICSLRLLLDSEGQIKLSRVQRKRSDGLLPPSVRVRLTHAPGVRLSKNPSRDESDQFRENSLSGAVCAMKVSSPGQWRHQNMPHSFHSDGTLLQPTCCNSVICQIKCRTFIFASSHLTSFKNPTKGKAIDERFVSFI